MSLELERTPLESLADRCADSGGRLNEVEVGKVAGRWRVRVLMENGTSHSVDFAQGGPHGDDSDEIEFQAAALVALACALREATA